MKFQLVLLFIFASFLGQAQEVQEVYSYIHERVFKDPSDLIGYNFRPFKMEIPGDYAPTMIEAGEYSFGITRGRLYVSGKKIRGLYEINNIAPANYGYKLTLLDPSNPANRGHLKVITNKYQEVEAVVFKKASKANEIIFHLSDAPKSLIKKEQEYFTDLGEITVEETDSLWGTTIHPYLSVNTNSNIQGRLYFADSMSISFEEVITIKEKKKKKKRKKKRRKKKSKKMDENEEMELEENEPTELDENINIENLEGEGTEKENIEAEERTETEEAPDAAPNPVEEEVIVKRKITKSYFVKIKTKIRYKNGTSEMKVQSFPIKKIEEKEDVSAKKTEERFQVELKTKGKKKLYLYLNGDRTISSFELNGVLYLVRGH